MVDGEQPVVPILKKTAAVKKVNPSISKPRSGKKPSPLPKEDKPTENIFGGAVGSKTASVIGDTKVDYVADELPPNTEMLLETNVHKAPLGSLGSDIRIFQIYFEAWQKELLDTNFISLDNSASVSELLEFDVFIRLFSSEYVKGAKLWGALSWRFSEKTGLSGQQLLQEIKDNSGYDVYFCNPTPENEALYHNMWLQGVVSHPNFIIVVKSFFEVCGLPLDALLSIEDPKYSSVANYFIGTEKFWETYLDWVKNILVTANKKQPSQIRDLMHSVIADNRGLHGGSTYTPFIIERLFPVFMKLHADDITGFKLKIVDREKQLDVHLRMMKEMKTVAHSTKSLWLAACWVNYRNLYLTNVRGREWCQKYLTAITPQEIKFD